MRRASQESCRTSPPGSSSSTGAVTPTPCRAGTFANATGSAECVECAPGQYQTGRSATACHICGAGGFCERGAMAVTLCSAGTFGNETGLASQAGCHTCPPGYSCSVGAQHPVECPAGSVAPNASSGRCTSCAAGTYQPEAQLSCVPCEPGSYCGEGSSAPLPPCLLALSAAVVAWPQQLSAHLVHPEPRAVRARSRPPRATPERHADEEGCVNVCSVRAWQYQPEYNATGCVPCLAASYCPASARRRPHRALVALTRVRPGC